LEELDRIAGQAPGSVREFQRATRLREGFDFMAVPDLAPGAVARFRQRYPSMPYADVILRFGAPSLTMMAGGLVTRARERNVLFREVAFEDHGTGPGDAQVPNASGTLLFFGGDAVTLHTLPQFRSSFELMRAALTADARVVLMHCWAFSDGGRLAIELSAALRRPVLGMNGLQTVGDQRMQGPVLRAHNGRVEPAAGVSPWVAYFD
jgi:hypothetical protein